MTNLCIHKRVDDVYERNKSIMFLKFLDLELTLGYIQHIMAI